MDDLTNRYGISYNQMLHDLTILKMQHMDNDLQEVKRKVTNIDLTLENEIRVNIRRVAEGHLDLSRHLHDAIKTDTEKEMLVIRVNMLESELRRMKDRLDQIA